MINYLKTGTSGDPPETLVFLHIPKAAGSTFYHVLSHRFPVRDTFLIEGAGAIDSLAAFRGKSPEERGAYRFISGHMPFGIHQEIPGPAGYITMLRDPLERVLSLYYFIRQRPRHYLHELVGGQGMSLPDLLTAGASSELTNAQTRLLAGEPYASAAPCSDAMYEKARAHLASHFIFTGLTERFDESLLLLRDTLRWRGLPFYVRRNVNAHRPPRQALSDETLDALRAHNHYDLALYQTVRDSFDARLAEQGPRFQKRLARFRALNRLLQPAVRLWWMGRHFARCGATPAVS
ncbi:MAG: hypothetical protein EOM20_12645 [Spartobacteria bacterium]|nr:hypothetical protein [Spartobacteria bacterium]